MTQGIGGGEVVAVHSSTRHAFSKGPRKEIELIAGLGVRGDAHAGAKVQHLSRVRADPTQPNLRQVHLMHCELFEEMVQHGFEIGPGELGENISTRGIDLLALGRDDRLHIGDAVLTVTGLRNPCAQIEAFSPGLLRHLAYGQGEAIVRKAGIMTIVERGGWIHPGDAIRIEPARNTPIALDRV